MSDIRTVLLLAGGLLIGAGGAAAETADCRARLKRQDAQCQALAEKLAEACPSGTDIKETAACRAISGEIASSCTRKPCAAPRRGRRARSKSRVRGAGMGEARSRPARRAAPRSN